MQMETKFLRFRTPVEFGTRFGDWQVCWLGGWARFRLYFLVMLVKIPFRRFPKAATKRHRSAREFWWRIAELTWLLVRTEP